MTIITWPAGTGTLSPAGTYTKGKSKGIYVYTFNSKTAEVKEVSTIQSENPSLFAGISQ